MTVSSDDQSSGAEELEREEGDGGGNGGDGKDNVSLSHARKMGRRERCVEMGIFKYYSIFIRNGFVKKHVGTQGRACCHLFAAVRRTHF